MRPSMALIVFVLPVAFVQAQPALVEAPEYPSRSPGPNAYQRGDLCFHLATGAMAPGDVDWVQVTLPRASTRTVVDVDFPSGSSGSALLAAVVGGSSAFNISDNNALRDALCGLSGSSTPIGSPRDSAVELNATPKNAVINIGITGAEDAGFAGRHAQTFQYDVWVYVNAVPCTSDADCTDGVPCTIDSCNLAGGVCTNTASDGLCANALFCDGDETCHALRGCQPGLPPNCDDGVSCTIDACDDAAESCVHSPSDSACANGLFCDGAEWCDPANDCQRGTPPDCDDGVGCTLDSCDETLDACVHAPDDGLCDNDLFCDGEESCDALQGCRGGSDPCSGRLCRESDALCVECLSDADCGDGDFCNGSETCDASGSCRAGSAPCPPGQQCNPQQQQCETLGPAFDFLPEECPNRFKIQRKGLLSAVLIGTHDFDVTAINVSTLRLSRVDGVGGAVKPNHGPPGPRPTIRDVATPVIGEACQCHTPSADGTKDLMLKFNGVEMAGILELESVERGAIIELIVTGNLRNGQRFSATDCIVRTRHHAEERD